MKDQRISQATCHIHPSMERRRVGSQFCSSVTIRQLSYVDLENHMVMPLGRLLMPWVSGVADGLLQVPPPRAEMMALLMPLSLKNDSRILYRNADSACTSRLFICLFLPQILVYFLYKIIFKLLECHSLRVVAQSVIKV